MLQQREESRSTLATLGASHGSGGAMKEVFTDEGFQNKALTLDVRGAEGSLCQ